MSGGAHPGLGRLFADRLRLLLLRAQLFGMKPGTRQCSIIRLRTSCTQLAAFRACWPYHSRGLYKGLSETQLEGLELPVAEGAQQEVRPSDEVSGGGDGIPRRHPGSKGLLEEPGWAGPPLTLLGSLPALPGAARVPGARLSPASMEPSLARCR